MRRSRNLLPLLVLLLLAAPLAAQDSIEIETEESGPIRGSVRDAATGAEVPDARVEIRGVAGGSLGSAVTGSTGAFTLDSVPRGDYTIAVQHPDYLPSSQTISTNGQATFGVLISLRKRPATAAQPGPAPAPEEPAASTGIPRAAQDAMNRGMDLMYVRSDFRGSLDQFERAIREYPSFYEAYTQIGVARTSLGEFADAERAFRKAIELSQEKFADAFSGLAVVFSNTKKYADAEAAARKAVALNPGDWRGHGELARALHGLQRYQDAEAPAEAAARLAPSNPTLQLLLSSIHLQLKKLPAMLEDLDAYLLLVPSGPDADRTRDLRAKVQQAIAAASPGAGPAPRR
jgi:tetratricopeptide (TPR) repeat protein